MRSGLLVGKVTHRRKAPFRHDLSYRTYSLIIDLDELDLLDGSSRWFSHNRWNVFSLHDRDHGPRDGSELRPWIEGELRRAGIPTDGGRIEVILYPRVLGYQFNPLTIWLCRNADDELQAVLYEIHNTFGHSHSHLVPVNDSAPHRHSFAKQLHVSPFFDRAGTYSFTLRPPGDRFSVSIDYASDGVDLLTATLVGSRRSFTDWNLSRVFLTHPLLTLKIVTAIHWNALRILVKGGRYRPVPEPPEQAVAIEGTLVAT